MDKPVKKTKSFSKNSLELETLKTENRKLMEELKKRDKEIAALTSISRTVVSDKYLEEILQLIVTVTAETINSKICSIMLLDKEKQELIIKATQSLSREYKSKPNIKVGQSISGKAVKLKKPVMVANVTEDPGYMFREVAKNEGIVSMLCVPMMIKGKVIGVINSYTENVHEFSEDEIEVLQTVAHQAAVAIENTKLMEESVAAREALEMRKVIERAKGLIMKNLGLGEDAAYKLLNKKSMDSRKPMKEIAEAVILSYDIMKGA